MDARIAAVYCLCADLLAELHHRNDAQCHVTDADYDDRPSCRPVLWWQLRVDRRVSL